MMLGRLSRCRILYLHSYRCLSSNNKIVSNFIDTVDKYPDRFAAIHQNEGITYSELYINTLHVALFLKQHYGIKPLDCIATLSYSNHPQILQIILALHMLHAQYVALNVLMNPFTSYIPDTLHLTQSKLCIVDNSYEMSPNIDSPHCKIIPMDQFDAAFHQFKNSPLSLDTLEQSVQGIMNENNSNSMDEICQYISTSGTTGTPKKAMHSFNNKYHAALLCKPLFQQYTSEHLQDAQPYPNGCRLYLGGAPFHATTYLFQTYSAMSGNCIVYPPPMLPNETDKALKLWRALQIYRVNSVCLVPWILSEMVKHQKPFVNDTYGEHLKTIFVTGDAANVSVLQKFMKLMCNNHQNTSTRIANFYGSTESEPVAMSDPILLSSYDEDADLEQKWMRLHALDECKVRINDEHELEVYNPAIMKGYLNDEVKTKQVLTSDGYYVTGEEAVVLNEQMFKVIARKKDMIKTQKGNYITPTVVENVLMKHENVQLAVVVPVAQHMIFGDEDETGYLPVAFVTCAEPSKHVQDELYHICNQYLSKELEEIPVKIILVDEIPCTATGKIKRKTLIEMANGMFRYNSV
eukprot:245436_1